MARVAFLTTGVLRAEWGDPIVQGFVDRTDPIFAVAKTVPGHIRTVDGRAGYEPPYSRFYRPGEHSHYADTLSLWANLEAVFAFAYHGMHGEAFRMRREWFASMEGPNHAAWWVQDDHIPDWVEAYEMQWQLHQLGPSATAFNLRNAFDSAGNPYRIDRDEVHRIVEACPDLAKLPG